MDKCPRMLNAEPLRVCLNACVCVCGNLHDRFLAISALLNKAAIHSAGLTDLCVCVCVCVRERERERERETETENLCV